jgi:predicted component of type VI protein secretion system
MSVEVVFGSAIVGADGGRLPKVSESEDVSWALVRSLGFARKRWRCRGYLTAWW